MVIVKETEKFFNQDKKPVIEYLKNRGIYDSDYFALIEKNPFGFISGLSITVNDELYDIMQLLTNSDTDGYDVRRTNKDLNLTGSQVAIATVAGDDVICYDIETGVVYLWLLVTGEGEKIPIAYSLKQFVELFK